MKDIGAHAREVYNPKKQGLEVSEGRGANVLLFGGPAILCNGGALRDSRSAGSMCVGGYLLRCGGMCVRPGCGGVCAVASYDPW